MINNKNIKPTEQHRPCCIRERRYGGFGISENITYSHTNSRRVFRFFGPRSFLFCSVSDWMKINNRDEIARNSNEKTRFLIFEYLYWHFLDVVYFSNILAFRLVFYQLIEIVEVFFLKNYNFKFEF